MEQIVSRNGVPVRLTSERWLHIIENHDDLAGYYDEVLQTVEDPERVLRGYGGALIAVRALGRRRYLAVIYRGVSRGDGFVITAHLTSRMNRRSAVWSVRR